MKPPLLFGVMFVCAALLPAAAANYDYRVLATTRTSTMEKEMNAAANAGFVFAAVMGGETAGGGKEAVVIMMKEAGAALALKRVYRLLATSKTSTMEKEMQQLGDEGFDYLGQTVFQTALSGSEVAVIMERDPAMAGKKIAYRLLATSRTSTMQKELKDMGDAGYRIIGLTVAKTTFGGAELISILRKD
jgi:hypothetical protein